MITVGSLCTGAAGLDMAVADAFGETHTAWVSEVDADASRVLAGRLPGAPNLGDLTAVDWRRVEPVDVVVAGFPCQPFSVAGKRKGTDDERWIWPDIAAAVRGLQPRLVLLENPPGILADRGIGTVLGDLAEAGFDAEWESLQAAEVGAPHERERIFFVAYPTDPYREPVRPEPVAVGARVGTAVVRGDSPRALMPTPTDRGSNGRGLPGEDLAQARRAAGRRMLDDTVALLPTPVARDWKGAGYSGQLGTALLPTPTVKDSAGGPRAIQARTHDGTDFGPCRRALLAHHADRWAQYGPAIARWEAVLGRPAPEPTAVGKRGGRRLSGRFVEWLMGWPDGWVTDLVDNTASLRLCGNGVVRQQGAAAYRLLLADGAR